MASDTFEYFILSFWTCVINKLLYATTDKKLYQRTCLLEVDSHSFDRKQSLRIVGFNFWAGPFLLSLLFGLLLLCLLLLLWSRDLLGWLVFFLCVLFVLFIILISFHRLLWFRLFRNRDLFLLFGNFAFELFHWSFIENKFEFRSEVREVMQNITSVSTVVPE